MSLRSLPPESQLLWSLVSDPHGTGVMARLLAEPLDWPVLLDVAAREKALPTLLRRAGSAANESVPAAALTALRRRAMVMEFRYAYTGERLAEVLELLAAAGIEVMLLKGAALASTVYDSFVDRPMGDLDLLVHPHDAEAATALLLGSDWKAAMMPGAEAFYRSHQHLPPFQDTRGADLCLDLHTDLLPKGNPFDFTAAALWSGAASIRVGGAAAHVPPMPAHLVYLCIHFAWSHALRWGAWTTLRDVRTITDRTTVDWDEFLEIARRCHGTVCCYWTCRLARSLVRASIPEAVIAELRPDRTDTVLDHLDQHFSLDMLASGPGCPSARLRRKLWKVGLGAADDDRAGNGGEQPGREPWPMPDMSPPGTWRKSVDHLQRLAEWRRYLAGVLR